MSFLSRPLSLTAIGVAGVLGLVAWVIVRQTSAPPAASADDTTALASATTTPGRREAAAVTTTVPHPAAPPASATSSGEDEKAERGLALEVRSLVASGEIGKARARANAYYARFPNGPAGPELERLTGAHPTRDATGMRPSTAGPGRAGSAE